MSDEADPKRLRHLADFMDDYGFGVGDHNDAPFLRDVADRLEAARRFKKWVHDFLDACGCPADPDPQHTAETGCRISGRMRWLLAFKERAAELEAVADRVCDAAVLDGKVRTEDIRELAELLAKG
jgi:hypothetical protein